MRQWATWSDFRMPPSAPIIHQACSRSDLTETDLRRCRLITRETDINRMITQLLSESDIGNSNMVTTRWNRQLILRLVAGYLVTSRNLSTHWTDTHHVRQMLSQHLLRVRVIHCRWRPTRPTVTAHWILLLLLLLPRLVPLFIVLKVNFRRLCCRLSTPHHFSQYS